MDGVQIVKGIILDHKVDKYNGIIISESALASFPAGHESKFDEVLHGMFFYFNLYCLD